MAEFKSDIDSFAKIKVVGVGGSGGSAINRMVQAKIRGVDFLAVNTDIQALQQSLAGMKMHIGRTTTRGLGAGMNPNVGAQAAEESQNEIRDLLKGADMVFITCGLGGGTGTGAAPMIAQIAKEVGALTVGVVTKPFSFEGAQRREIAERGLHELRDRVDAIITIPNDRLLQIIDKKTTLLEAFRLCDEVLQQGVQGIAELITIPGLINVDFADVKAIMENAGQALMGIGRGVGENRAMEAARAAISSPLLELSIEGARGILFSIEGGPSLGMHEVNEAAKIITQSADPNAKIIFGAVINERGGDEIKITVIATNFTDRPDNRRTQIVEPAGYTPTPFIEQTQRAVAEPEIEDEPILAPKPSPIRRFQRIAPAKLEPVMPAEPSEADELEVPAILRRAQMKKAESAPAPTTPEDEELDIPAFIRKKMK